MNFSTLQKQAQAQPELGATHPILFQIVEMSRAEHKRRKRSPSCGVSRLVNDQCGRLVNRVSHKEESDPFHICIYPTCLPPTSWEVCTSMVCVHLLDCVYTSDHPIKSSFEHLKNDFGVMLGLFNEPSLAVSQALC